MINTHPLHLSNLFEKTLECYRLAEQVSGEVTNHFYKIGEAVIQLRFANAKLVPLITPAFAHLEVKSCHSPALTIYLSDDASTTANFFPSDLMGTYFPDVPKFWHYRDVLKADDDILVGYNSDSKILNVWNKKQREAIYWVHDISSFPIHRRAAPLLAILHWWTRSQGWQILHAGAIGQSKGGILLIGQGGAGKSSTALNCLKSKLSYLSDDYCLITTQTMPQAYSLFNTGKISHSVIKQLPHLNRIADKAIPVGEKNLLFMLEHYPEKIINHFPIRALLIPRITKEQQTRIIEAPGIAALKAAAPNTIMQLPNAGEGTLRTIAELIRKLPCFYLELGNDFAQIPNIIDEFFLGLL